MQRSRRESCCCSSKDRQPTAWASLQAYGELPENVKISETGAGIGDDEESDGGVEFGDEDEDRTPTNTEEQQSSR